MLVQREGLRNFAADSASGSNDDNLHDRTFLILLHSALGGASRLRQAVGPLHFKQEIADPQPGQARAVG